MHTVVPPDGPTLRISQPLGPETRGSRLDAERLEMAVAAAAARLAAGADLLLVDTFDERETAGRGSPPAIALAPEAGVDVPIGVNSPNLPVMRAFAGEEVPHAPPDPEALLRWIAARPC